MSQGTKLFVMVLFLFVIFTTMRGHLSEYLKLVFK